MVEQNKITRDDFKLIVAMLKTAYPNTDLIANEYTFNLWYSMLQDIPYPTLNRAAQNYIMSNHFPPGIADIRQLAYDLSTPADDIAAEEWSKLMKALGYSGLPEPDAYRYWESLPDITKEIVGSFAEFKAWGNTQTADLMTVQRPMFIKRYEERMRTARSRGSVPNNLQTPTKQLESSSAPMLTDRGQSAPSYKSAQQPKGERTDRFVGKIKDEDYVDLPPGVEDRLALLRQRLSGVKGS